MRRLRILPAALAVLGALLPAAAVAAPDAGVSRAVPAISGVTLEPAEGGRIRVEATVRAADATARPARETVAVAVRVADRPPLPRTARVAFRETRTASFTPGPGAHRVAVTLSRPTSRWLAGLGAGARGKVVRVFADQRIDLGRDGAVDHYRRSATTLAHARRGVKRAAQASPAGVLTLVNGTQEPVNTFGSAMQCVYDQGTEGSDPSGFTGTFLLPSGTIAQGLTPDLDSNDVAVYDGPAWADLEGVVGAWDLAPSQWLAEELPQGVGYLEDTLSYSANSQNASACGQCPNWSCPVAWFASSVFQLIGATADGLALSSTVVAIPSGGGFALLDATATKADVAGVGGGEGYGPQFFYQQWGCALYGSVPYEESCPTSGLVTDAGLTWVLGGGQSPTDWTMTLQPATGSPAP